MNRTGNILKRCSILMGLRRKRACNKGSSISKSRIYSNLGQEAKGVGELRKCITGGEQDYIVLGSNGGILQNA